MGMCFMFRKRFVHECRGSGDESGTSLVSANNRRMPWPRSSTITLRHAGRIYSGNSTHGLLLQQCRLASVEERSADFVWCLLQRVQQALFSPLLPHGHFCSDPPPLCHHFTSFPFSPTSTCACTMTPHAYVLCLTCTCTPVMRGGLNSVLTLW